MIFIQYNGVNLSTLLDRVVGRVDSVRPVLCSSLYNSVAIQCIYVNGYRRILRKGDWLIISDKKDNHRLKKGFNDFDYLPEYSYL